VAQRTTIEAKTSESLPNKLTKLRGGKQKYIYKFPTHHRDHG